MTKQSELFEKQRIIETIENDAKRFDNIEELRDYFVGLINESNDYSNEDISVAKYFCSLSADDQAAFLGNQNE